MKSNPFVGMPPPAPGCLTLYGLGPGFGESLVLHMPDGLWMVIDGCTRDGINLPLALLDAFDQRDIDLLVVTHPDEDHIRGLDEILHQKTVHTVWRYPFGSMVRDFLALQLNRSSLTPDHRLEALFRLHDAFHRAARAGQVEIHSGGVDALCWNGRDAEYEVVSIAPTTYDAQRMRNQFDRLMSLHRHGIEPTERMLAFLRGERTWSDRPNAVSLGLSIRWGGMSLVLGGDVENGTDNAMSGWKGIVRRLTSDGRRPDRRVLLRDPVLVKIAHHGAGGAFDRAAWALHCHSRRVPFGLIMPFDAHRLPDVGALLLLRERVDRLFVTSKAGCEDRVVKADWRSSESGEALVDVPMVAIEFTAAGEITDLIFGGDAGLFARGG